jgi:tight adherence protein C
VSTVRGIAVVALGATGIVCALSALSRYRRPVLRRRLTPYLEALDPRRSGLLDAAPSASGWAAALDPLRRALAARLHAVLDDGLELTERLEAAGSDLDASAFRSEQVTWGLVGLVSGLAFALLLARSGRSVPPLLALGLATFAAAGGVLARDRVLSRAVDRRRSAVRVALPTAVDLVCLAVTAGESLRSALGLVAETTGPLAEEIRRALRVARGGTPLVSALEERARVVGVAPFERFTAAIGAAQERGVPLGDALRALAFDLREHDKRELIELAGRKQVSMLVPVIALILPVAIAFAFYPGVVAIRTLAR